MIMRIIRRGSLAFLGLATAASVLTQPATEAPAEPSVRPGVNEAYLKTDVNVNQWVERFEREGREIYEQRERILRAAKIKKGATVADVGTGTGLFVPLFAHAVGAEGQVYAVDIVEDFLTHIKKSCEVSGITNVRTVKCSERSVELPEASIDLAFICDVYHHFEYPRSSLASIRRALKTNGELVMVEFKRIPGESSDWILDHVRAGQEVFTEEIEQAGFEQIEAPDFLKDNYVVRFRKTGR